MSDSKGKLGPSIWLVSDGRAGNAAQTRAIAAALSDTRRWMQIAHISGEGHRKEELTLEPRAPWTWFPSSMWVLPKLALPKSQSIQLSNPLPTLWLAAGRRSAPFTKAVRKWSHGETFTVQVLDPKMDPADFDLVIVPEHDRLDAPNVLKTIGSPAHFSEDAIEHAGQVFADLADEPGKSVIVVLGGDSKAYRFTQEDGERLVQQLRVLAGQGCRLRITTSRRTPLAIAARVRAFADEIGARYWAGPEDGPNPYLGWLLYSDAAIVTEDSTNMLSEAAWHGLPLHIARLTGNPGKLGQFHSALIERGIARWFEGRVESWSYEPLREAERVAERIVAELLKRHPQPRIDGTSDKTAPPHWMTG